MYKTVVVWVVLWLFGFAPIFLAAESLEIKKLRLKEDFDIISEFEDLAV